MRLVWLPGFFEAGIAISDDPDNGSFEQFKTIYDLLRSLHLPTTRAMWAFEPREPTGTPHLTTSFFAPLLSDAKCLEYCKALHADGFEICLHGASSGNNDRDGMVRAFELLEREIGPARTYICHSKNAENLYWDDKVTASALFSFLLRLYTKNKCFGDMEASNYFWGDLCRSKIDFIRLFRTRQVNTLAFNPGMPYHDFSKPYVNFWFSATKGYLARLFEPRALEALCAQNGASIVYQYLHKYVDAQGGIDPKVRECLERVSADSRILFRPASAILERLRQFRLIFPIVLNGKTCLINASQKPVESVQVLLEGSEAIDSSAGRVSVRGRKADIGNIGALSVRQIPLAGGCRRPHAHKAAVYGNIVELRFPNATVVANCSPDIVTLSERHGRLRGKFPGLQGLEGFGVKVFYSDEESRRLEVLEPISSGELRRLFWGQAKILLREHLLFGRKISSSAYLKSPGSVEDQSTW